MEKLSTFLSGELNFGVKSAVYCRKSCVREEATLHSIAAAIACLAARKVPRIFDSPATNTNSFFPPAPHDINNVAAPRRVPKWFAGKSKIYRLRFTPHC